MFRDTQEELKRLEEQLLQEEEAEEAAEELSEEEEAAYEDYDPDRIYNTDDLDEDPEALSREVLRPRKKGGLSVAICLLLLAAAFLIVAATVLRLRG